MYTFKKLIIFAAGIVALSAATTGCIENDIPYPKIQPNFTSFEVEGALRPAVIDSASRTVTVFLNEETDIQAVKVLEWGITKDAVFPDSVMMNGVLNLSDPVEVTMSIYQDYVWTISAVQNIERYFTIASQVGSSEIDVENKTVKALVPKDQPIESVEVRSLKLAGPLAAYSPELVGKEVDFTDPVSVTVSEFGRETQWTITVEQTEISVMLEHIDAWTCVAWLYGEAEEDKTNGFEYRMVGSEEWTAVPQSQIVHNGGSFSARIGNLIPETEYVARAISDDLNSAEHKFTTGSIVQLPNSNFSNWFLDDKIWCPWDENGEPFWGTGNKGATKMGSSNTTPIDNVMSTTGYEGAQLKTEFKGVGVLGKLAAGNIFTGDFVRVDGTDGVLSFGRSFVERPTKLLVTLKYQNVNITHTSSSNPDFKYMKGEPDTCIVWCALADWDEPFEIRTKPSVRQLFSRYDDGVIAYGEFTSGNALNDYQTIEIPLDYVSTSRVPRYIIVTGSASKYGDYFTGGNGSTLWIKDISLGYD